MARGFPSQSRSRGVFLLGVLALACGDGDHGAPGHGAGEAGVSVPAAVLSGGEGTVFDDSPNAFSLAARNLLGERRDRFFVGNAVFNRSWVTAPSSTEGLDGLGPTFNARSCSSCHFKDGRGAPPEGEAEEFTGLLVRLSVPGTDEHGAPAPEPNYGGQFNHRAILGVPAEGASTVRYEPVTGAFDDGTPYELARPIYEFSDLAFGPFADGVQFSPRTAPAMIGLGLLEAIDESTLTALADAEDADGDGVSGRPNDVWDPVSEQAKIGRFGWKANQAGLLQQNSGAFLGDIGITSPLFPGQSCPAAQTACAAATAGGEPEVDDAKIDAVTYYSHLLAVPARRMVDDEEALRGEVLFGEVGCPSCHVAELRTGTLGGFPELSDQTIHPYTDLLLHDMGEDLADHRPDFDASGTEWRTPPLWGLGLLQVVNRHDRLLHDGRARGVPEAILWHGGEAAAARDAWKALPSDDREAVVRFLESL